MTPANDNHPRSPAEHRAYVAALSAQQDADHEVRARNRNWPTGARLQRARAWPQLDALRRYAEDEGLDVAAGFSAANDNAPADESGRTEISRIDSRLDEECPDADAIMEAWRLDEKDRQDGRPELATRIQFGAYGKITAVKVRGRYRSLVETFSEPRGPAEDKAKTSLNTGYGLPDEQPDAQEEQARRLDHDRMKKRLGPETCRILELACGDTTAQEIGEMYGRIGKTAERFGVEMVDKAIGKLMAAYAERDAGDMAA
jgi:hypothetical protein